MKKIAKYNNRPLPDLSVLKTFAGVRSGSFGCFLNVTVNSISVIRMIADRYAGVTYCLEPMSLTN